MLLARLLFCYANCSTRGFATKMADEGTIYAFKAKDSDGAEVSLEKYRYVFYRLIIVYSFDFSGKVVIIVNTASQCGLTNANYTQLKELLDKYKPQGLEVAAFPCNQFANEASVFICAFKFECFAF